jgi:hypothetical protein
MTCNDKSGFRRISFVFYFLFFGEKRDEEGFGFGFPKRISRKN